MPDFATPPPTSTITEKDLLEGDEQILIVDDYPDIIILLRDFLQERGFSVITAGSAAELHSCLENASIALVLLDIGLPDADGTTLLPELKERYRDLTVIMLTAVTDLETALVCLRQGADDYLTKPVQFAQLLETVRKVLEKRRLTINNRRYQREIEQARFRLQLSHELALKMNTAYLSMIELDKMLQAILVGITAEEGLQFNRAFLALYDESGQVLEGRLAIGPGRREDAVHIWGNIRERKLSFHDILNNITGRFFTDDTEVNRIVQALRADAADSNHVLIRATRERRSINVVNGKSDVEIAPELLGILQEDCFVVVPLFSPSRSLGVIIADHFITNKPISEERIRDLESFAGQASLAIEHCHLYMAMEHKIQELEAVTNELEKNKDLLVEAERYSAVGHMAAQLAHSIRNPITSIGGTARLLARKTSDPDWLKFLKMMATEVEKVEATLQDLFTFVEQVRPEKEEVLLSTLIHKSMMLHYSALQRQGVEHHLVLPKNELAVDIDPRLIHQVLIHLVRNSLEAMPAGGELNIELRQEGGESTVIISDSGHGLTDVNLQHATDPFFTTKTFGTGMGLTLVKRIVDDHGGRLTISNRKPKGTVVSFSLPISWR